MVIIIIDIIIDIIDIGITSIQTHEREKRRNQQMAFLKKFKKKPQ